MGDNSPKSKQRDKNQKSVAKAQVTSDLAKRQAGLSAAEADKKKKK